MSTPETITIRVDALPDGMRSSDALRIIASASRDYRPTAADVLEALADAFPVELPTAAYSTVEDGDSDYWWLGDDGVWILVASGKHLRPSDLAKCGPITVLHDAGQS